MSEVTYGKLDVPQARETGCPLTCVVNAVDVAALPLSDEAVLDRSVQFSMTSQLAMEAMLGNEHRFLTTKNARHPMCRPTDRAHRVWRPHGRASTVTSAVGAVR